MERRIGFLIHDIELPMKFFIKCDRFLFYVGRQLMEKLEHRDGNLRILCVGSSIASLVVVACQLLYFCGKDVWLRSFYM